MPEHAKEKHTDPTWHVNASKPWEASHLRHKPCPVTDCDSHRKGYRIGLYHLENAIRHRRLETDGFKMEYMVSSLTGVNFPFICII